jgi:phospholipid/cholesterol/gamma-HCH transport system permease protein
MEAAKGLSKNFQIERISQDKLKLVFFDSLDINSVAAIWDLCLSEVIQNHPRFLLLDFKAVNYCDGAGIALIQALEKQQIKNGFNCSIDNLNPNFEKLLSHIEQQPDKIVEDLSLHESIPEQVGRITIDILKDFRDNIIFLGTICYQLFFIVFKSRRIRWGDFFRILEDTGPQALPIVALIGFLIGLISTFQAAPSFEQFGMQIYMVNLVGLGLVRELGPLLTSVLLSGRTASSFAAEIGTMKVNQEIDALKTMGLDPIRFLVFPRILAAMIVTPILEVFFIIFGLLGSLVVMLTLGYTTDSFINQLYQAIEPIDYIGGLIKVFVFGIVIAGIGCLHGIKTRFGAQAVGHSTTQAVVSSMIMLVIVDGVFASIYYVLGI